MCCQTEGLVETGGIPEELTNQKHAVMTSSVNVFIDQSAEICPLPNFSYKINTPYFTTSSTNQLINPSTHRPTDLILNLLLNQTNRTIKLLRETHQPTSPLPIQPMYIPGTRYLVYIYFVLYFILFIVLYCTVLYCIVLYLHTSYIYTCVCLCVCSHGLVQKRRRNKGS